VLRERCIVHARPRGWGEAEMKDLVRVGAFSLAVALTMMGLAVPVLADRPEPDFTMVFVIRGADPCSGTAQTVTIVADFYVQDTNGASVMKQSRTITTDPTGYVGRGEATVVNNGQVIVMSLHDTMVSSSGARVRIGGTIILDASTTPPTPIVVNITRACIQPA